MGFFFHPTARNICAPEVFFTNHWTPVVFFYQSDSVLPLRFCEKVGFFSGTDKATSEGGTSLGGSGGMLPRKFLKIEMQIEPFYSI